VTATLSMIARSHLKIAGLFLLKLLGTAIFLYWAFSQIDDKQSLGYNFKLALQSPFWLSMGLAFGGITVFVGALRWYALLKTQSLNVTYPYILRLTFIAALLNIASIGGAAGNAARMISVMRRNPGKKMIISMTVMMDHMVGFIATGVIFLCFAWGTGVVDHTDNPMLKRMLIGVTVFEVVCLLVIALMFVACKEKFLSRFKARFPKAGSNVHFCGFTTCINIYRSQWRASLVALGAGIVLSVAYFLAFFAGLRTIGEQIEVATLLTVMPIVDVVSSLPISISGLGVREKTFEYMISEMTSIGPGSAVSASLIGFLFHVFWGLGGGAVLIFHRSHPSEPIPESSPDSTEEPV